MKKYIAEFVAKCPNFKQVKVENQSPGGLAQTIELPEWKWEIISMEFITGLAISLSHDDSILVIVDKMTKSDNFLSLKITYSTKYYANL